MANWSVASNKKNYKIITTQHCFKEMLHIVFITYYYTYYAYNCNV